MSTPYVTTDSEKMDWPWLFAAWRHVPNSAWLRPEQMFEATHRSIIFGLFLPDAKGIPNQIGFVRVVSDWCIFSSITDVYVVEHHRRHGYGTLLMKAVLAHPAVRETICILATKDKQSWYHKLGFRQETDSVMKRGPQHE
jgi:GNAT superfamily N-acetyltransferase